MRRFFFNGGILGAVFGLFGALRTTLRGPRDWRIALVWIGAAISLVLAIAAVADENKKVRDVMHFDEEVY